MTLIKETTRIAFSALIHDLGKLTERAKTDYSEQAIKTAQQIYCPVKNNNGYSYPTHKHAAYTALSLDEISNDLPILKGEDFAPFANSRERDADDSLINASAKHHKPDTLLQWIIAKADRIASGFEREEFDRYNQADEKTETGKNHYQARLLSIFELIDLEQNKPLSSNNLKYRIPLKPLTVASQFPKPREQCEPGDDKTAQSEYQQLWSQFKQALKTIPKTNQQHLTLWLDHFDTLYLQTCHAIPSATAFGARPDVSLYDHSKAVTALATALWRYLHETDQEQVAYQAYKNKDIKFDQTQSYTLIQGDFFGIQNFIFNDDEAGNSQKHAARLLRGRSFLISLLTELAAIKILDTLELPSTSQIINAAGKFMILAPNTENTHQKLTQIQNELDQWFLQHTYGQSGIGLVSVNASNADFINKTDNKESGFEQLMKRLFEQLESAKYQRYNLTQTEQPSVFTDYLDQVRQAGGVCEINGRYPANGKDKESNISLITQDQIQLGKRLANPENTHLVIYKKPPHASELKLEIFGYHIRLIDQETAQQISQSQAELNDITRIFDIKLPSTDENAIQFHGFAKRFINAYVPLFGEQDQHYKQEKYAKLDEEEQLWSNGDLKTLHHLAAEDRQPQSNDQWIGISALHTLKGDVDNLGLIFQKGLTHQADQPAATRRMTFAKMASLSRQLNQFFTLYLPWLCKTRYPNTYTVFAGGDDFFLIGPWRNQIKLAKTLRHEFEAFCAHNPQLSFSAGLALTKAKLPIRQMAVFAENALEHAKSHVDPSNQSLKNAINLFNHTFSWSQLNQILQTYEQLLDIQFDQNQMLSTGYIYSLIELCNMAEQAQTTGTIITNPHIFTWRSKLVYRTQRLIRDKQANNTLAEQLISVIGQGINQNPQAFKAVVNLYLYTHRT